MRGDGLLSAVERTSGECDRVVSLAADLLVDAKLGVLFVRLRGVAAGLLGAI